MAQAELEKWAGRFDGGMDRGQIVDIDRKSQHDARWLRQQGLTFALDNPLGRRFSLYRCADCGCYGVIEGVGPEVLLIFTMKRQRCQACNGCDCDHCREQRLT